MQIANLLLSVKNYTTLVKNNKLMFIDVEKGTIHPKVVKQVSQNNAHFCHWYPITFLKMTYLTYQRVDANGP